jgi:minor extracellular serine protease Vpr
VRRLAPLALLLAVVAFTGTASADLGPIERAVGQLSVPRVRHGPVVVPSQAPESSSGRIRVIVTLAQPPLAAVSATGGVFGFGPRRKLNVASSSSQSYLERLDAAQQQAISTLHRTIPEAVVSRRFRIVLDGLTVTLPYTKLTDLMHEDFAQKVYPSLRYTFNLNRSTSIIGVPAFQALTGASGAGVKVAVVDDGVDEEHPFFNPAGFAFPPGFPKGPSGATTPKVIVARGFAGPGANSAPLDRDQSFHGTHVSGVIAGVAGTDVPAGAPGFCSLANGGCHPAVKGLSGVAPRAWIGNYRVFNVPEPLGGCCSGNTPEIVAAFEAAVADGMDVINFSGGGPQSDPRRDALIDAVANVARAGVVPVISAGNDRDFFGLGTVGSPGTAPDAISVAAVTNGHVFTGALHVLSPSVSALGQIVFVPGAGGVPPGWETADQRLVDVGTITGTDGKPVSRLLCAASGNPNDPRSTTIPAGSLRGAIALVTRGNCTFDSKAERARAAGAIGIVVADDRAGDPGFVLASDSGGMISSHDGARLRAAMAGNGGAATIRVTRPVQTDVEVGTTWAGVPTSFSAGGLTPFGHQLKPDIAAPGAQVLSSTLPEFAGDQYAFLDGTSFSAPHIAGVAALLLQRHPSWTPKQVKSALMSTAGPTFDDTALTHESPVLVEGAGLARVAAADHPLIFTDPQSLSFAYLDATKGATSKTIQVAVSDAGDGAGTWQVELQAQAASGGATVEAAPVTLASGGTAVMQVVARAANGAAAGDDYGFVVLRRGDVTRRIPYAFSVTRSGLAGAPVVPLKTNQTGDTRTGEDRADVYRWPTAPFGIIGLFGVDTSVNDTGSEKVYSIDIPQGVVNAGAVITDPALRVNAPVQSLLTSNAPVHPWFLGSLDENDVLGYAGIPVNANGLMPDFIFNVGAAGVVFPPAGRYYVVVDSGRDPFTGRSLAGRYVLHSWVNDLKPPNIELLTPRISAGRPTIVARMKDAKSGVDPLSLLLLYKTLQLGATSFDPETGIAVFPYPRENNPIQPGNAFMRIVASDFQEAKNIADTGPGTNPMPNTKFKGVRMTVVDGPAVNWLSPSKNACLAPRAKLLVVATSTSQISSVGLFDGNRKIARIRKNVAGIYSFTVSTKGRRKGPHVLKAIASDTAGRESEATRPVRVCR